MNERFTLDSTLIDIVENERVNRKLPLLFDMQLCEQVKWPFNKMKMKHMMKPMHFPGQQLLSAANFILERREAGEKISIPVWRDLPEGEEESAQNVVLIPFLSETEMAPAVMICPGREDHHLKMMTEGMKAAERIIRSGCHAFILNYRSGCGAADMLRAVRFLRVNCRKLGILPEKVAVLAFQEAGMPALEIYMHAEEIQDMTHRYDGVKGEPDQLWLTEIPKGADGKAVGQNTFDDDREGLYICRDKSVYFFESQWLEERLNRLKAAESLNGE